MIAGLPDSVFPKASSRKSKLNPAFCFTPPWQVMHFLLNMGFTSVLKSTWEEGIAIKVIAITKRSITEINMNFRETIRPLKSVMLVN